MLRAHRNQHDWELPDGIVEALICRDAPHDRVGPAEPLDPLSCQW